MNIHLIPALVGDIPAVKVSQSLSAIKVMHTYTSESMVIESNVES
jgi:hypothetical protein